MPGASSLEAERGERGGRQPGWARRGDAAGAGVLAGFERERGVRRAWLGAGSAPLDVGEPVGFADAVTLRGEHDVRDVGLARQVADGPLHREPVGAGAGVRVGVGLDGQGDRPPVDVADEALGREALGVEGVALAVHRVGVGGALQPVGERRVGPVGLEPGDLPVVVVVGPLAQVLGDGAAQLEVGLDLGLVERGQRDAYLAVDVSAGGGRRRHQATEEDGDENRELGGPGAEHGTPWTLVPFRLSLSRRRPPRTRLGRAQASLGCLRRARRPRSCSRGRSNSPRPRTRPTGGPGRGQATTLGRMRQATGRLRRLSAPPGPIA